MAEFRGYKCDRCSTIVEKADLTRRTVRYIGSTVNGEYDEDLCTGCTEGEVALIGHALRPLRRRAPRVPTPA